MTESELCCRALCPWQSSCNTSGKPDVWPRFCTALQHRPHGGAHSAQGVPWNLQRIFPCRFPFVRCTKTVMEAQDDVSDGLLKFLFATLFSFR